MKLKKLVVTILGTITLLSLVGCISSGPTKNEIKVADHGPAPSKYYKELVDNAIRNLLLDPESAKFTFGSPVKGHSRKAPMYGYNTIRFGWRVCGTVNAKNIYGGYTGATKYYALIKNGLVIVTMIGYGDKKLGVDKWCGSITDDTSTSKTIGPLPKP
jgi:hypothetical protein